MIQNSNIKNNNERRTEMGWVTNSNLVDEAKKQAKICIETGENEREIEFGNKKGLVFVTTDPESINPIEYFELENRIFYLGMKK